MTLEDWAGGGELRDFFPVLSMIFTSKSDNIKDTCYMDKTKTAKISNFLTFVGFWKDGLSAELQARMSRSLWFVLFFLNTYQVPLKWIPEGLEILTTQPGQS